MRDDLIKELGELKGTMTSFLEETKGHRIVVYEKLDSMEESMAERFRKIEDELSVYKTIYRTIKFIGLLLIAIVTLKFGDVKTLWSTLNNGTS